MGKREWKKRSFADGMLATPDSRNAKRECNIRCGVKLKNATARATQAAIARRQAWGCVRKMRSHETVWAQLLRQNP